MILLQTSNSVLLSIRVIMKLYDQYMEAIRIQHQLSQIEITIISYLHNNPGSDTARDICEMRMLPKGSVSQGVESLIKKDFLLRTPDTEDRRRIHLSLTDHALPIIEKIEEAKTNFMQDLFAGLTSEEAALYHTLHTHIITNAKHCLERKNDNE